MERIGAAEGRDESAVGRPGRTAAGSGAGDDGVRGADAGQWVAAFTALLAAALVLHVLWWHGVVVRSPWLLVVVAAAAAVARPSSVGRLAVLLSAAALAIVLELPALGSHLLLVLAVAVCVLVHVAAVAVGGRRLPAPGELVAVLGPFLRASVVVLYVAAVLSKLNHDYLDAAVTPVAALTAKVLWFAPEALDGAGWRVQPAIWGSLLIELSLPVLLFVRRTRTAGLVVGLAFHGVLALSGTVPFTALMLAFYVAFLPEGAVRGIARRLPRPDAVRRADLVAVSVVLGWIALGTVETIDPGRITGGVLATATRLLVAGASFGLLAAVVVDARGRRAAVERAISPTPGAGSAVPATPGASRVGDPGAVPSRSPGPPPAGAAALRAVYAAGVVALVLVAAGPYVGIRTGDAFTMYSALDTHPDGWNHLFVPRGVHVFD